MASPLSRTLRVIDGGGAAARVPAVERPLTLDAAFRAHAGFVASVALRVHPEDPRAPLAAFTLGRVHLEDLGAPRDAALAFARARTLAPGGPLAEDALAREVEAWSRTGETETARVQALIYTQRYPKGRRVHAVRRFGGLESP